MIAVPFGSHRIEMTFGSLRLLLYYNPDLNFHQSKNTIIINTHNFYFQNIQESPVHPHVAAAPLDERARQQ